MTAPRQLGATEAQIPHDELAVGETEPVSLDVAIRRGRGTETTAGEVTVTEVVLGLR